MSIIDIYSKRQKRLRGEGPDVLIYELPLVLKNQIVFILKDTLGTLEERTFPNAYSPNNIYKRVHDSLVREYGVERIGHYDSQYEFRLIDYFRSLTNSFSDTEKAIDLIELLFRSINIGVSDSYQSYIHRNPLPLTKETAISELNERFKENAVGFQFESGNIIRMDSTFIHSEITRPTLMLLNSSTFVGPNEEYLKAHEHYRHGRNKECLNECLKAFESTMKVICTNKGWHYNDKTDTAKKLINICFTNGLVPASYQTQFSSLINLLESGIPSIRNKVGGHGQGVIPQSVDDGITRYGMNLTGSNIIFLIEQSSIL